jgi:anti-sigma B factor antagonist
VLSESGGHTHATSEDTSVYIDPTSEDTSVESFGLEISDQGSTRVVRVSGEIDILSAPDLREALLPAFDAASSVVLDLSGVSFLGSSGLAVLVEARDQAERSRHQLRLVRPSRVVSRALEATGLLELFDIDDDLTGTVAVDQPGGLGE